jgi:hypothetical protein
MKGVINKGIKEMIENNYGVEKWEEVRKRAGCEEAFFSATDDYPDHLTMRLFRSACETLSMPVEEVMIEFGKFWINETGKKTYPQIFQIAGKDARSFLRNMDRIHLQATRSIPDAAPPHFEYEDLPDGRLAMHYFGRQEMVPMLKGLILGVGMYFKQEIGIEERHDMKDGATCTIAVSFK